MDTNKYMFVVDSHTTIANLADTISQVKDMRREEQKVLTNWEDALTQMLYDEDVSEYKTEKVIEAFGAWIEKQLDNEPEEMPQMEGTLEALDNLTIRNDNNENINTEKQ